MLSVRIPTELRAKLARAARNNGNSMAKEMARLLDTQLFADIPIHSQFELAKTKAGIYQKQLACLEDLVLDMTDPGAAQISAARVARLNKMIQRMRLDRSNAQEQIEAKIQARSGNQSAEETAKSGTPFSGLLNSVSAGDTQLELSVRRWVNLRDALSGKPRGTKKQLALELAWTPPQISQLLSSPNDRNHRAISTKVARKLEHALSLKAGALYKVQQKLVTTQLTQAVLDLDAVAASQNRPHRRN